MLDRIRLAARCSEVKQSSLPSGPSCYLNERLLRFNLRCIRSMSDASGLAVVGGGFERRSDGVKANPVVQPAFTCIMDLRQRRTVSIGLSHTYWIESSSAVFSIAPLGAVAAHRPAYQVRVLTAVQPMPTVVTPPNLSAHKPAGDRASRYKDPPQMPSRCP